jgi:glycerol-3-phosphate acyltransferase PlsY
MIFAPLIGVVAFLAYLLGSLPFGLIVGRIKGIDIRQHGSGNIGATNVWRVLGKGWGLFTFALDFGKGLAAVLLAEWITRHWSVTIALPHDHTRVEDFDPAAAGIAAAVACILGHNFPVWLGFKGGKGVATSLGVIGGLMPVACVVIFLVWVAVLKISRYVSLASIIAALSLPIVVVILLFGGWMHSWAHFYFAVVATLMVIIRHRSNIHRLITGTENRFGKPKAETEAEEDAEQNEGQPTEPEP